MKKTILLVALVFILSCSITTEPPKPSIPVAANIPAGIPVLIYQPIKLDYSARIKTHVATNTENGGFIIPAGTPLVFDYEAITKNVALPAVSVEHVPTRLPSGCPLVINGQNSNKVSLVFTGTDYFDVERKEIKAASEAYVVFLEGGGLKPKTPPTPVE